MRSRLPIALATVVAVLLVGAGAIYAYDSSGRGTVPRGVSVAGIDLGGLSAAAARAKLEREYLARLRAPVRVRSGGRTFVLTARESRVAADLGGMVDDALAEARSGTILTRTWRRLSGASLRVDLRPRVTYAGDSVARLVARVRAGVERAPRDATVSFSTAGLSLRPGRDGVALQASDLRRRVERAISDPFARHTLTARTRRVAPKIATAALRRQYATAIVIDRASFRLRLFEHLRLARTYPIGVGMQGLETPAGLYHVQSKAVDPAWTKPYSDWVPKDEQGKVVAGGSPQNPLKARWLGIYDGAGIHGIAPSEYGTIGQARSHGCVRMRIPDVIALYDRVAVGTPIYIA